MTLDNGSCMDLKEHLCPALPRAKDNPLCVSSAVAQMQVQLDIGRFVFHFLRMAELMTRRAWWQAYARDEIKSLGEICFHFVSCADGFICIPDLLPFFPVIRKFPFTSSSRPGGSSWRWTMQTLCWTSVIWIEFSDYSNDGQATLEIIDVFKEAIHKKKKQKQKQKKPKQNKTKK